MSEELHKIEELPDLKVAWHESYKCLDEPLLEYVWEVANHFLPDYEDVSAAPAIFANRYAERNLSVEERYERTQEMKTFKGNLEAQLYTLLYQRFCIILDFSKHIKSASAGCALIVYHNMNSYLWSKSMLPFVA